MSITLSDTHDETPQYSYRKYKQSWNLTNEFSGMEVNVEDIRKLPVAC